MRERGRLNTNHQRGEVVATLWRPFRLPTFRNLLIADIASDVGTFMQGVGAAWMMVSLHAGPLYVALTQTASALPFFILALPAGAIGDIVDRRRLILSTEIWMASVAIALTGNVIPPTNKSFKVDFCTVALERQGRDHRREPVLRSHGNAEANRRHVSPERVGIGVSTWRY